MAEHRTIPAGTPTQVAHPWKAVLRTLVASLVGAAVAWLARTAGIDLADFSEAMTDSLTAAAWTVGTGLAQWVLTRPALLPYLELVGLGTGVEKEPAPLPPEPSPDEMGG